MPAEQATNHASEIRREGPAAKSKVQRRPREQLACTECNRRKQKCDRRFPCQNCINRRLPERCRPAETNGVVRALTGTAKSSPAADDSIEDHSSSGAAQDAPPRNPGVLARMTERIARLERLLSVGDIGYLEKRLSLAEEAVIEGLGKGSTSSALAGTGDSDSDGEQQRDERDADGDAEMEHEAQVESRRPLTMGGLYVGELSVGAISGAEVLRAQRAPGVSSSFFNIGPDPSFASRPMTGLGTIPQAEYTALFLSLPPMGVCHALIDRFFSAWDFSRYPLPTDSFPQWPLLFNAANRGIPIEEANEILPILAITYAAIALGSIDPQSHQAESSPNASAYFWAALKAFLYCDVAGIGGDLVIFAKGITMRYAEVSRNLHVCNITLSSWITGAGALGYQRDGEEMGLPTKQSSLRRVYFSHILHADCEWSIVLGRARKIGRYTTRMPNEADLMDYSWDYRIFLIHRNRFIPILISISEFFQDQVTASRGEKESPYIAVQVIDKRIQQYLEELPPYLSHEPGKMDLSLDDRFPRLPFFRHLTMSHAYFFRIALNRPFMIAPLRKKRHRYPACWKICVDTAVADLRARKEALTKLHVSERHHSFGGAWAHFNSAVTLGLSMLISLSMGEQRDPETFVEHLGFLQDYFNRLQQDLSLGKEDGMASAERKVVDSILSRLDSCVPATVPDRTSAVLPGLSPSTSWISPGMQNLQPQNQVLHPSPSAVSKPESNHFDPIAFFEDQPFFFDIPGLGDAMPSFDWTTFDPESI